jgi:flagellar basal-body rod protein FlgG
MSYAVQGAIRQEKRLEILANHMANSATTGFKTQVMSFDDMLQARMSLDTSQGELMNTENPLDLAISGEGFFKIQTDHGVRYTRNGNFGLNDQGILVNGEGHPVLGAGGRITINVEDVSEEEISINSDGEIEVDETIVGSLAIVNFEATDRLRKEGNSLLSYNGPETDGVTPADVEVIQGHLEQSNVEVVKEMTNMIETNRYYESFQKLMQTLDELDGKVISDVGKVGG